MPPKRKVDVETDSPRRSKRTSVSQPQYKDTGCYSKKSTHSAKQIDLVESDMNPPKRRGRPPKSATAASDVNLPKKRGRPAKNATAEPESSLTETPKKRGRPRKDTTNEALGIDTTTSHVVAKQTAKREGAEQPDEALPARKRGRPRKNDSDATYAHKSAAKVTEKNKPAQRGPGRPAKTKPVTATVRVSSEESHGVDNAEIEGFGEDEEEDGQYWLMKAEPNDRFENGHNVKFSIDDLAAAAKPEPWDGVRNAAARNNMRAMRKGDLAFFYHSNCSPPGIVGVMRIVQEHSTDESAFDPSHPYFDPKSVRDNPKWEVVHVEFVKKFNQQITLKMLSDNAASTGELSSMQVVKLKRLSVTSVKPREWRYILGMAGEDLNIGREPAENGEVSDEEELVDGHESEDGQGSGVTHTTAGSATEQVTRNGQPTEDEIEEDEASGESEDD